jgi:carboxymethylenebutenolidase
MRALISLLAALLLCSPAFAQPQHPMHMNDGASAWAAERLDASPRHHEYVTLQHDGRKVTAFVVYPEVKSKAPAIVLIHEIFGLTPWAKEMADELAGAGYVVIAPDLLSGEPGTPGSRRTGTESFPTQDAAVQAVSALDPGQVTADLDAAADYVKKLPAVDPAKLYVTGFCWGGGKSFLFATHRHDLSAAFVFYGPPPPADAMQQITAPVYGFYAGNDARISSTVPQTTLDMKADGKLYEPVLYDGAGHGFMRAGEAPDASPANAAARSQAFKRLLLLLGSRP